MSSQVSPNTIYLKDYRKPAFRVLNTNLDIAIHEGYTQVTSRLEMVRDTDIAASEPLRLYGVELEVEWLKLNDRLLAEHEWRQEGELLVIENVLEGAFFFQSQVRIYPEKNTALEGLYRSGGMYCTQCEAEGFRKITFYPDRPDVMAKFSTTISADKIRYPVLLANGNCVATGELEGGRHFATWEDPFPKPSYLFAMVAGNLACRQDTFTTCTGRNIDLRIYTEPQDSDKVDHAMSSLKRAMRWDEEVYGREYDLDIFMIVAVSHFNMGAMENKGLNIFNTSCVLAHPDTTTDAGFQRVESVIAHEYFHNWSGNRVTCRDWFQLSLKEGFTVFRDQEFSADMLSKSVQRIEDVNVLRTFQFTEDAGPLAHPVRPESFVEINNFYTATVYEKGAEIVRMLHTLLGKERFRKGSDLYFSRHDGRAVTVEDFVAAMGDANNLSLEAFMQWYRQPGTPTLHVRGEFNEAAHEYTLHLRQELPHVAGFPLPQPLPIPVKLALLRQDGKETVLQLKGSAASSSTECTLLLTNNEQPFIFSGVESAPVPSVLRDFSAPVRVEQSFSLEEKLFLLQHDSNGFNQWLIAQEVLTAELLKLAADSANGQHLQPDESLLEAFAKMLPPLARQDAALAAKILQIPGVLVLMDACTTPDPDALQMARQAFRHALARRLEEWLLSLCENGSSGAYEYHAAAIAGRSLRNTALSLLVDYQSGYHVLAVQQYRQATNMTSRAAALQSLVHASSPEAEACLVDFAARWQHEALVMDQWFAMQASAPSAHTIERVLELSGHPDFHRNNPNRVRALIGQFANNNPVAFHQRSGRGYALVANEVKALDALNPQIAARLLGSMGGWRRMDKERQESVQRELQILSGHKLSGDVQETLQRLLLKP